MNKNLTDFELQNLLRADNKEALEMIYTKHRNEFLNYAKKFNLSKHLILDIYQDAIIAMHQNFVIKKLNLNSSSIKTYLFGIGKFKILNKLKQDKRLLNIDVKDDAHNEIIIDDDSPSEQTILLSKNLEKISDSCKKVLKLYYYRNLTIDEIVAQTDYKDGNTVRSHKSRCLKRLKSLFKII